MQLTKQEAKLIIISLKARVSRLRNKRSKAAQESHKGIDFDISRTLILHDKFCAQYPQAFALTQKGA